MFSTSKNKYTKVNLLVLFPGGTYIGLDNLQSASLIFFFSYKDTKIIFYRDRKVI